MCGRYYIADEDEMFEMREIINEVNERYTEHSLMTTGEIFPTNVAPVLIADKQIKRAIPMTWGYPKWQGLGVVINVRAETAMEKPMFRTSIANRRCIVPSNGFFEWDHQDGRKEKYLVRLKTTPMLYMAGLYSEFKSNGIQYTAFVIITTDANRTLSQIHDRMPLVLERGQTDLWLHNEQFAMTVLTKPCEAEMMVIRADR